MTLEEAVHDLRSFVDANPYRPKDTLLVTDDRYKRMVEIDGQTIQVTLALIELGSRKMYQLDIESWDTNGKYVHGTLAYKIKAALLDKATELGVYEERRRYILAAN